MLVEVPDVGTEFQVPSHRACNNPMLSEPNVSALRNLRVSSPKHRVYGSSLFRRAFIPATSHWELFGPGLGGRLVSLGLERPPLEGVPHNRQAIDEGLWSSRVGLKLCCEGSSKLQVE